MSMPLSDPDLTSVLEDVHTCHVVEDRVSVPSAEGGSSFTSRPPPA